MSVCLLCSLTDGVVIKIVVCQCLWMSVCSVHLPIVLCDWLSSYHNTDGLMSVFICLSILSTCVFSVVWLARYLNTGELMSTSICLSIALPDWRAGDQNAGPPLSISIRLPLASGWVAASLYQSVSPCPFFFFFCPGLFVLWSGVDKLFTVHESRGGPSQEP